MPRQSAKLSSFPQCTMAEPILVQEEPLAPSPAEASPWVSGKDGSLTSPALWSASDGALSASEDFCLRPLPSKPAPKEEGAHKGFMF